MIHSNNKYEKTSILVIHPHWLLREGHRDGLRLIRECTIHGSYNEYIANLRALQEYVAKRRITSRILNQEFSLIGIIQGACEEFNDITRQFGNEGIEKVLVAGELGPYSYGNGRVGGNEGCVGIVARVLKTKGFQVRGIKRCVFPLMPYESYFLRYCKMLKRLPELSHMLQNPKFRAGVNKSKKEIRNATITLYSEAKELEEVIG